MSGARRDQEVKKKPTETFIKGYNQGSNLTFNAQCLIPY